MSTQNLEELKYPIGKFEKPDVVSPQQIKNAIEEIAELPIQIEAALEGLSNRQLDTPYRPEGWTIRQVVHHIPDSHMNAYVRFKLALTEENPTIRPYFEDRWANLKDTTLTPVNVSVQLLKALHQRWVILLRSMNNEDSQRTFFHPEKGSSLTLAEVVLIYAWHGKHHLGHILLVKNQ
ncbi:YfiT family bacillithiol transferase [Solitalea lacus]|uniref:YfiT family bacillithiol transferase n=1 Tax=Solitalea lacus TaxID=2911172 RepID=UPI001ED9F38B|nr:putative metal-dependent hydrolase [Solitalea lacus]UKJ07862.1 putative metal-dependent hydrolase [Solitalea lacus]